MAKKKKALRQEQRAEAQAKFQLAQQTAAIMAAKPINLRAFIDDYLSAYNAPPVKRLFRLGRLSVYWHG